MISIPLDKMSLAEKLEAMEALWADLSRTPSQVPVPVGNVVRISAILDCRRDPDWIHRRLRSTRDA
jgi:hypothetical protein